MRELLLICSISEESLAELSASMVLGPLNRTAPVHCSSGVLDENGYVLVIDKWHLESKVTPEAKEKR